MKRRPWLRLLLLGALLGSAALSAACGSGAPRLDGPALVLFYTEY